MAPNSRLGFLFRTFEFVVSCDTAWTCITKASELDKGLGILHSQIVQVARSALYGNFILKPKSSTNNCIDDRYDKGTVED